MVQYQKKPTKHARCGATGVILHGVSSSSLWGSFAGAAAAGRATAQAAAAGGDRGSTAQCKPAPFVWPKEAVTVPGTGMGGHRGVIEA